MQQQIHINEGDILEAAHESLLTISSIDFHFSGRLSAVSIFSYSYQATDKLTNQPASQSAIDYCEMKLT